jgi:DNA-binding transcriptional ArsR family regulator
MRVCQTVAATCHSTPMNQTSCFNRVERFEWNGCQRLSSVVRFYNKVSICVAVVARLTYNHMVVDELTDRDVDRIFRALADRTRRSIFERVLVAGLSVSTLADDYDMSFAAVQKHVRVLERASLVTKRRNGREQIVLGNMPTLRSASALLDAFEQIWIQRDRQIAEILGEGGNSK